MQPNYINVHMNANMGGGTWRIGRWQNIVSEGENMRLMQDFRRMRFGLGVALLTDGYYGTSRARAAQFNRQATLSRFVPPPRFSVFFSVD